MGCGNSSGGGDTTDREESNKQQQQDGANSKRSSSTQQRESPHPKEPINGDSPEANGESNANAGLSSGRSGASSKSPSKGVQFSEKGGGGSPSSDTDAESEAAAQKARNRSKSIAVLEGISRDRQKSIFCQEPLAQDGEGGNESPGTSYGQDGALTPLAADKHKQSPAGDSYIFGSPLDALALEDPNAGATESSTSPGASAVTRSSGSRRRSSFAPPKSRQRRLSSVFNEFATQVDIFLTEEKDRLSPRSNSSSRAGSPSNRSLVSISAHSATSEPFKSPGASINDELGLHDGSMSSNLENNLNGSTDPIGGTHLSQSNSPVGEVDDLRRIFDAFESEEGTGLTAEDLKSGFERMGYGGPSGSSSAQLLVMFKAADKKKTGRLQWPEFKAFFRHLADMNKDDLAEEEDQTDVVRRNDRERAMSFAMCPVTFKSYTLEPLGSLPSRVKALSICPHRKVYAASDRFDNQAHIFDLDSGERVRSLVGHKDSLLCICLSPDRKYIATCSRDGFLTLWDSTIGCELGAVQHPGIVTCCAFTSDGKVIVTGCQDNIVRRFKCHRAQLERTMLPLPQTELGVIVAVAAQKHAKEKLLFSRSNDKGAYLLDYATFRVCGELQGHTALVWQVDFCHNGIHAISVCEKELRIWEVITQTCLHTISSSNPSPVGSRLPLPVSSDRPKLWTTAQFAPPQFGSVVIACCTDTNLFLYDVSRGKMIWNETSKSTCYVASSGVDVPCILLGDDLGNILRLSLHGIQEKPSYYQDDGTYVGGGGGEALREKKILEAQAEKEKEKDKSSKKKRR